MHTRTALPIRVITHNVRYATRAPFPGEEFWSVRLPLLVNQFRYHTSQSPSALLCLQEVLRGQLMDILQSLNAGTTADGEGKEKEEREEWASVGVGRDDGAAAGEYAAILYRPAIWNLTEHDAIWLSETPRIPGSKGWDAASVRIVTVAVLRHIATGKKIVVLNTHLDDQGVVARKMAAGMLRQIAEDWSRHTNSGAVILTGDLNSEADGDAYKTLTATDGHNGMTLSDVREPSQYRYGDVNTFTGFEGRAKDLTRLDYVFTNPSNTSWTYGGYGVLPNRFEDGVYLSDHRAVVIDLELK